jgi:hypothetical protein
LAPDQFPVRYTGHQRGGTWSRVVSNPDPGVWQIAIDNCDLGEMPARGDKASFTVTAALLGVTVESSQMRTEFSPDFIQPAQIRYTNSHAAVVTEIAGLGLASVFATNVILAGNEQKQYEIEVVPGTTRVGASVANFGDASDDVDLYLFDCTAGDCTLRDFSTGTGASEEVAVDSPAAGKWKVVVDLFSASDRRNTFQYKDYLLHPAYGRVDVPINRKPVAHGANVAVPVTLKIGAVPVVPRALEAMLLIIARPGPNTDPQKTPDALDLYFPDQAILGAASIKLPLAALQSTRN